MVCDGEESIQSSVTMNAIKNSVSWWEEQTIAPVRRPR